MRTWKDVVSRRGFGIGMAILAALGIGLLFVALLIPPVWVGSSPCNCTQGPCFGCPPNVYTSGPQPYLAISPWALLVWHSGLALAIIGGVGLSLFGWRRLRGWKSTSRPRPD